MKSPDEDQGLDQSSNQTQTEETLDTGVNPEPQQEEQHESQPEPEPEPEQRSPKGGPPALALIKSRIQQLQNRRFLLLQMQHFKKKRGDESSGTREDSESAPSNCCHNLHLNEQWGVQGHFDKMWSILWIQHFGISFVKCWEQNKLKIFSTLQIIFL